MALTIELELSEEELAYFSRIIEEAWESSRERPEAELIAGARAGLERARHTRLPQYVASRLRDIEVLLDLLDDSTDWPLDADERRHVVAAIAYFAIRNDVIPDDIPALGYLDDALIADLVGRELAHELEAYREFRAFRETEEAVRDRNVTREDWLRAKRELLFDRLRAHRERLARRETDLTHPILRYRY